MTVCTPHSYAGPKGCPYCRIAELEESMRRLGESWLTKDFSVLYRCAKAFSDACLGLGAGKPYEPHRELQSQLARLAPAFTDTEEVRRLLREKP